MLPQGRAAGPQGWSRSTIGIATIPFTWQTIWQPSYRYSMKQFVWGIAVSRCLAMHSSAASLCQALTGGKRTLCLPSGLPLQLDPAEG